MSVIGSDRSFGSQCSALRPYVRPTVRLPYILRPEDMQRLQDAYPGYNIQYSPRGGSHPHAVSASARQLEYRYIFDEYCRDGYIRDIGASVPSHIGRVKYDASHAGRVHLNCPHLDTRDSARHKCWRVAAKPQHPAAGPFASLVCSEYDTHHQRVRGLDYANMLRKSFCGNVFCGRTAQTCQRRCDIIISVHGAYDIPFDDWARIMVQSGASVAYLTMNYSPEVLMIPNGVIPEQHCSFSVDKAADRIDFTYEYDSSLGYSHSYANYCRYFLSLVGPSWCGRTLYMEITAVRMGTALIRMVNCANVAGRGNTLVRQITMQHAEKYTVMETFTLGPPGDRAFDHVLTVSYIIPAEIVTRLMTKSTAARYKQKELNTGDMLIYANAACTRITNDGKDIIKSEPLDFERLNQVVQMVAYATQVEHDNATEWLTAAQAMRAARTRREKATALGRVYISWADTAARYYDRAVGCVGSCAPSRNSLLLDEHVSGVPIGFFPQTSKKKLSEHFVENADSTAGFCAVEDLDRDGVREYVATCAAKDNARKLPREKARQRGAQATRVNLSTTRDCYLMKQRMDEYLRLLEDEVMTTTVKCDIASETARDCTTMAEVEKSFFARLGPEHIQDHFALLVYDAARDCYVYNGGAKAVDRNPPIAAAYDPYATDAARRFVQVTHNRSAATYNAHATIRAAFLPRFLVVSDGVALFQAKQVLDGLRPYKDARHNSRFVLHTGPPGAGKTYEIIHTASPGDLIFCETRSTKDACRRDVEELARERSTRSEGCVHVSDVRTVASLFYNIASVPPRRRKTVFVDEALMMHAGIFDFIAILTQCECMHLYGDPNQIPYITRCGATAEFAVPEFDEVVRTALSYRIPQDVCAALHADYGGCIRTTNKTAQSLHLLKITGIAEAVQEILTIKPQAVLAVHQAEKKKLQRALYDANWSGAVNTVHEVQGRTFDSVVLVRLASHASAVFKSRPHCIVAISRHRQRFSYLTVVADDMMAELMGKATDRSYGNYLSTEKPPVHGMRTQARAARNEQIHTVIHHVGEVPGEEDYTFVDHALRPQQHFGQLKLLLNEMHFFLSCNMVDDAHTVVIYVGCSRGAHIAHLLEYFPTTRWMLFDPVEPAHELQRAISAHRHCTYSQAYLNDENLHGYVVPVIAGYRRVFFICDARTDEVARGTSAVHDQGLCDDLANTEAWLDAIQPHHALVKFKVPVDLDAQPFGFDGDLFIPIYGRATGYEVYLNVRGCGEHVIDARAIERRMVYYNWRMRDTLVAKSDTYALLHTPTYENARATAVIVAWTSRYGYSTGLCDVASFFARNNAASLLRGTHARPVGTADPRMSRETISAVAPSPGFGNYCAPLDTPYVIDTRPEREVLTTYSDEKDTLLTPILEAHADGDDILPALFFVSPVTVAELPTLSVEKVAGSGCPVQRLQELLNVLYADGVDSTLYDTEMIARAHVNINEPTLDISPDPDAGPAAYKQTYEPESFYYRHSLQSYLPEEAAPLQTRLLQAADKRVFSPLVMQQVAGGEDYAQTCIDRFLHVFCVPEHVQIAAQYRTTPLRFSSAAARVWATLHERVKLARISDPQRVITPRDLATYMLKLKRDPKACVELDNSATAIQQPQLIAHHAPLEGLITSTVYGQLVERWTSMLRPNVCVMLRKSPAQLAKFMNTYVKVDVEDLAIFEVDISKFDKSQLELTYTIETLLMKYIGIDDDFWQQWLDAHRITYMTSRELKVRVMTMFQRKSGDASTLGGNTLYSMVAASCVLPRTYRFLAALLIGDDVLVLSVRPRRGADNELSAVDPVRVNQLYAQLFNLDAKQLAPSRVLYFASYFFCRSWQDTSWLIIADPVKRIERLCRRMRVDFDDDTIIARYVSFFELTRPYGDVLHSELFDGQLFERYHRYPIGLTSALYDVGGDPAQYFFVVVPDVADRVLARYRYLVQKGLLGTLVPPATGSI